jgi:hypothetical protein
MEVLKQSIFSTKEMIENGYNDYFENNSQKTNLKEPITENWSKMTES